MTCLLSIDNLKIKPQNVRYLFKQIRNNMAMAVVNPPQNVIMFTVSDTIPENNMRVILEALKPGFGARQDIRSFHAINLRRASSFLPEKQSEDIGSIIVFAETVDEAKTSGSMRNALERINKIRSRQHVEPMSVDRKYVEDGLRAICDADAYLDKIEAMQ